MDLILSRAKGNGRAKEAKSTALSPEISKAEADVIFQFVMNRIRHLET